MKKLFRFLAACIAGACLMTTVGGAFADVIWEPRNNFYEEHKSDMVYDNTLYIINGEKGYGEFTDSPDSSKIEFTIKNGDRIQMLFTYKSGGDTFGVCEVQSDGGEAVGGWINLKDTINVYDAEEFEAEYAKDIKKYDGEPIKTVDGDKVYFYTYPLSGEVDWSMDTDGGIDPIDITSTYTDADGRTWGYVSYYFGARGVWICVSDPTNGNLPDTLKKDYSDKIITPAETAPQPQKTGSTPAIVLAIAAAAGAALSIIVFWRKKEK